MVKNLPVKRSNNVSFHRLKAGSGVEIYDRKKSMKFEQHRITVSQATFTFYLFQDNNHSSNLWFQTDETALSQLTFHFMNSITYNAISWKNVFKKYYACNVVSRRFSFLCCLAAFNINRKHWASKFLIYGWRQTLVLVKSNVKNSKWPWWRSKVMFGSHMAIRA